jgi:hypothetical protein
LLSGRRSRKRRRGSWRAARAGPVRHASRRFATRTTSCPGHPAEIIARLGFPTVSYEECHRDTQATLRKILAYYEFDVDPARLSRAVANAEFGKMKRLEQSRTFPHHWLRPRNHSPKVRRGKVGGFNDVLSQEDIDYLNGIFGFTSPS